MALSMNLCNRYRKLDMKILSIFLKRHSASHLRALVCIVLTFVRFVYSPVQLVNSCVGVRDNNPRRLTTCRIRKDELHVPPRAPRGFSP